MPFMSGDALSRAAQSVSDLEFRPRPGPVGDGAQRVGPPVDPLADGPVSPTMQQEVTFLSGLNPDGTISDASYWGIREGVTAFKYGPPTAGTGATIRYAFEPTSNFTATEQATFQKALAVWESVADVHFVLTTTMSPFDLILARGHEGDAYTTSDTTTGSGATLGQYAGRAVISIDTGTPGFDLSGSFDKVGGYGLSTAIHEIGHALGLGHGGNYNFTVNPATQQYSAYDNRLYTIMSYLSYYDGGTLKYHDNNVAAADWGTAPDGYPRTAPHTVAELDILAIQALYGAPTDTPLSGGQTYGFNCNIAGPIHDFFDFTINTQPVVTLYNQGTGNILDLTGWLTGDTVNLNPGTFSNVGGLYNNLGIAFGTRIDTLYCGDGVDFVIGNNDGDTLSGAGGNDTLQGGSGNDLLIAGLGIDRLTGGGGDDTYYIDYTDVVVEAANGGTDAVVLDARNYGLAANVENLTFTGDSGSTGYGNELGNRITAGGGDDLLNGETGNDILIGSAGDDRLDGGSGIDTLTGGAGNDLYVVDSASDIVVELAGGGDDDQISTALVFYALGTQTQIEILRFTGPAGSTGIGNGFANRLIGSNHDDVLRGLGGNDSLTGGNGGDQLDGGTGADALNGGAGDDTYFIDNAGDAIIERNGQGVDSVIARIDYTLGDAIENLTLATGRHQGTGNLLDNRIDGSGKADTLIGLRGNDTIAGGTGNDGLDGGLGNDVLTGGSGKDVLTGGSGADRFVFSANDSGSTPRSADTIADFRHNQHDTIDLSGIGTLDFIEQADFSGAAGELRYAFSHGDTLVMADFDGDGAADLILRLTGEVTLAQSDFG